MTSLNNFVKCLALITLPVILLKIQYATAFESESDCQFQDTCEHCLSTHLNCSWCTDTKYSATTRCLTRQLLLENNCDASHIYENEPKFAALRDDPVMDYDQTENRVIQVQPQKVFVKLVKSHPQTIRLTYRPARQSPLDLYFLMDLTWTMRDDRETLVELGTEIAEALRNLTVNNRLGFGSFADKPVMPMVAPSHLKNPCAGEDAVCEPTYGFRHHLQLTDKVPAFVASVNGSRITGNLDNLEGGLDALMQVLVCSDEIGWKKEARKIVILVTDGFMHFAGDGLLAGITRRNDKRCHLSADGEYLGSLDYDYPSLEEIYRELVRRKVNVIFAVTADVVNTYREISGLMKEISSVEILSTDSSNILDLIKKSYESFVRRVQFTDNSPDYIKVDYLTTCGGQFATPRQRDHCAQLNMGEEVEFMVNLTLIDFPPEENYTQTIRIEESSLNELMEIQVEIQRPCPCTEKATPDDDLSRLACSDHGYLHCGMCRCDDGWTGPYCICSTIDTNATTNEAMENLCRKPFENSDKLGPTCSNRGFCECGGCLCMSGSSGKYCECPDCPDCDAERGVCDCGTCICKHGWSGVNCKCSGALDGCVGPSGEICSERGHCECNACQCDTPYLGSFCEIASATDNKLCTYYEKCVTCLIGQRAGFGVCDNISDVCSSVSEREPFSHSFVAELGTDLKCLVRLDDQNGGVCDHYFTYVSFGQSENYLRIQLGDCEPLNYYIIAGSFSFVTFLLGLAILCLCRYCLHVKDRREYARFEQDQRDSVLNESPLYKDPITRYKVPETFLEDTFEEKP